MRLRIWLTDYVVEIFIKTILPTAWAIWFQILYGRFNQKSPFPVKEFLNDSSLHLWLVLVILWMIWYRNLKKLEGLTLNKPLMAL